MAAIEILGLEKTYVTDPDDLPFIENGLPAGYVPSVVPKILPSDK